MKSEELKLLKRSFSKRLVGSTVICLLFLLRLQQTEYFSFSIPAVTPVDTSTGTAIATQETKGSSRSYRQPKQPHFTAPPPLLPATNHHIDCDRSHWNYDICSIKGPTVFDPTQSTFFPLWASQGPNQKLNFSVEKIRPYPRKWEPFTMSNIKEVSILPGPIGPPCMIKHGVPALVFSTGGYTGNFFHDVNDGFIPLFTTVNSIFSNQDSFIMVISHLSPWWVEKYRDILQAFSKYPILNADDDQVTHCFPSAHLGLISHGFVTINPKLTPNSKSMLDFRAFLEKAYTRNGSSPSSSATTNGVNLCKATKPQLVLASRSGNVGRVILNQDEAILVAKEVGFEVVVVEPTVNTSLRESYALINSSQVMVGVHGAALTHALFLRPNSVFIQIVPIGGEGVSELCFGKLAKDLGLDYIEYRIGVNESSLIQAYGEEHEVLKDPKALQAKGWSQKVMDIYLREQNIQLDLFRLRGLLSEAYLKAKRLMCKDNY